MALKVELSGTMSATDSMAVIKAFIEKETGRKVKRIHGTVKTVYNGDYRDEGTEEFSGFQFDLEPEEVGPNK